MKKPVDPDFAAVIRSRISERMTALGLTQAQLAADAEVSRSNLNELLKKDRVPGGDVLLRLADRLHVSIDYLVGRGLVQEVDAVLQELLNIYADLNDEEKAKILKFANQLKNSSDLSPK